MDYNFWTQSILDLVRSRNHDLPGARIVLYVIKNILGKKKQTKTVYTLMGLMTEAVIPHHSSIKPSRITVAVWAKKDDWTKSNPVNRVAILCLATKAVDIKLLHLKAAELAFPPIH